jgi:hypothetical protein
LPKLPPLIGLKHYKKTSIVASLMVTEDDSESTKPIQGPNKRSGFDQGKMAFFGGFE